LPRFLLFYATVFSGLYLAMMVVLLGLIFRAVAIEFRNKVDRPGWVKVWDLAFAFGSILPSVLYGVAIGNVLRGLELNAIGDYTGGFLALLNPFALVCGLTGLSMFAQHGALYLSMKLDGEIATDVRKWASTIGYVFLPLFMVAATFGIKNCIYGIKAIPMAFVVLALMANSVAFMFNKKEQAKAAFLASCCTIAFVMLAVASALFPNMVPCTNDPEWSLTVFNSSSSKLTLTAMLVIALIGMPVVLGYTGFIHRVFRAPVQVNED